MRSSTWTFQRLTLPFALAFICAQDLAQGQDNQASAQAAVNAAEQGAAKEPRFQFIRPEAKAEALLYKMTVSVAKEADPALKYALWPEFRHRKPGDAVPFYYRAMLQYTEVSEASLSNWKEEFGENFFSDLPELPLEHLPLAKLRTVVQSYRLMIAELHSAAYCENCNWDLGIKRLEGFDAVLFLLPDVQYARNVATVLALRARLQIADGEYEEALQTLRIGYKLAHDIAEPETLVNDMVGIAIAGMFNQVLCELMTAPNAPNLYWAIAGLPRPLIDMRASSEYEKNLPFQMFPFLKDAETVKRSPEEWRRMVLEMLDGVDRFAGPRQEAEFKVTAMVVKGYPRAKRELIQWGFPPEEVEAMAVCQVIAIHEARILHHVSHELFKWTLLPAREALPGMRKTMETLREEGYLHGANEREIIPVGYMLLSSIQPSVLFSSARIERELAALRVVEALRMHAAKTSQLPETLDEVTVVPLPFDPVTEKPFRYRREKEVGILEMLAIDQETFRARRFEITLQARE